MLVKIKKITSWQASLIIAAMGLAIFFSGLTSPFQGDDLQQIVDNVVVHSIKNVRILFEGGTFYNGQRLAPLTGGNYRPMMTTVYSALYSVFGPHTVAFHLFQFLLCIASAFILYLVFRYSFNKVLSLLLALVFLVHPLNSQVAFAIPSMEDVLFFFFGILAIWLLIRFKTVKSLWLVALCLLLSMLSKESSIVFIAMALLYLFWFNKDRLYKFISIMILPIVVYIPLRVNATNTWGVINMNIAPIDKLNLTGRLLTAPSIMQFYLTKFIFPWKLATAYYWVYPTFSIKHVLLPLIVDLVVVALVIYLAFVIHRKVSKELFYTYLFFAAWAFIGLIPYLQIIPADLTVCETWFYFSMVGWLGMVGVILVAYQSHIRPKWFLIIAALLVGLLGVRTVLRGFDYKNPVSLAYKNIAASKEDYIAYNDVAANFISQANFVEAEKYATLSVNILPSYINLKNLGVAMTDLGNYAGAYNAYERVLKLANGAGYNQVVENLGGLTLVYGNYNSNLQFLHNALKLYPQDVQLWAYLAMFDDQHGDNADAKIAIQKAITYGQIPQVIYSNIMDDKPFILDTGNSGKSIYIK